MVHPSASNTVEFCFTVDLHDVFDTLSLTYTLCLSISLIEPNIMLQIRCVNKIRLYQSSQIRTSPTLLLITIYDKIIYYL